MFRRRASLASYSCVPGVRSAMVIGREKNCGKSVTIISRPPVYSLLIISFIFYGLGLYRKRFYVFKDVVKNPLKNCVYNHFLVPVMEVALQPVRYQVFIFGSVFVPDSDLFHVVGCGFFEPQNRDIDPGMVLVGLPVMLAVLYTQAAITVAEVLVGNYDAFPVKIGLYQYRKQLRGVGGAVLVQSLHFVNQSAQM